METCHEFFLASPAAPPHDLLGWFVKRKSDDPMVADV